MLTIRTRIACLFKLSQGERGENQADRDGLIGFDSICKCPVDGLIINGKWIVCLVQKLSRQDVLITGNKLICPQKHYHSTE